MIVELKYVEYVIRFEMLKRLSKIISSFFGQPLKQLFGRLQSNANQISISKDVVNKIANRIDFFIIIEFIL